MAYRSIGLTTLQRVNSRRPRSRRSKPNASQKCNSVKSPIVIDNAYGGEVDNNSEVTLISRDGPKL